MLNSSHLQNSVLGTYSMVFVKPQYEKADINRAGKILVKPIQEIDIFSDDFGEWYWANQVLNNWRACHVYPINTFQSLLRQRVKTIDRNGIVAQRLKRAPSVIAKLKRFRSMKLSQMQDIGGLRAVVNNVARVRKLDTLYRQSRFEHELVSSKNYIDNPKDDGYRSIHLVYRYKNNKAPEYNDLLIEIQLRSKLQHAWATAVETMSTFLGQALKSGQGEQPWREFFEVASAAFTFIEETTPLPGYESLDRGQVFRNLSRRESALHVLTKLQGFSIAANHIIEGKGQGSYHLVILDSVLRNVTIWPFPRTQLEDANKEYAKIEARAQKGEQVEAVLVSAGPIEALKKAYPNYFLDTHQFVAAVRSIINEARVGKGITSHKRESTKGKSKR